MKLSSSVVLTKAVFAVVVFFSLIVTSSSIAAKSLIKTSLMLPTKPSLRGSAVYKNTLWVTGTKGSVFKSNDFGKSWQDVSPAGEEKSDFRDIEVIDQNTAIVMSVGNGAASKLLITQNGGRNWSLLLQNKDETGFYDSIDFWDRNNGLLLGDPVDGFYVILKTTDGGKSWRRISNTNIPRMRAKEAAFAASGNTLIVQKGGRAWFTTGGFGASAYFSSDFGEHWQRLSIPLYQQTATAGGYAVATNQRGDTFILGGDYQDRASHYRNRVMVSSEQQKGLDSLSIHDVKDSDKGLRSAMSCTIRFCLSAGKLVADWSEDQGKSWQSLSAPNIYTLSAGRDFILAAGADGQIYLFRLAEEDNKNTTTQKGN